MNITKINKNRLIKRIFKAILNGVEIVYILLMMGMHNAEKTLGFRNMSTKKSWKNSTDKRNMYLEKLMRMIAAYCCVGTVSLFIVISRTADARCWSDKDNIVSGEYIRLDWYSIVDIQYLEKNLALLYVHMLEKLRHFISILRRSEWMAMAMSR